MALYLQLTDGNYERIASNSEGGSDSVIYYDKAADFPTTGELEKLYVDKATGEIFTWNNTKTEYVAAGVTKAEGITYVNTDSSLSATDVQAAIDEVVTNMKDLELFKFPNATIIGQPIINNGQVSGFSASNYMKFPFIVNMQGRPFTIDIAFTTGTDITNQQNIIDGIDHGIAFAIRNRQFILVLGSKTGEWDISGGEKQSEQIVDPEKSYRVKISWDGSIYTFEYSDDGESYTEVTEMRVTSSLSLYPTQINIGVTSALGGIFKGIINMNYCSLTISDKIVWTGMDDVGLATRMAVDMSNIDQAGIDKIKSIAPKSGSDIDLEDYEEPESLDKEDEKIVATGDDADNVSTAFGKIEYRVDHKEDEILIYKKADMEEKLKDIPIGAKFIISDDTETSSPEEVKQARINGDPESETAVEYDTLKERLDTEYGMKVNKTTTFSVEETNNTVTVPEEAFGYAVLSKLSGNTLKDPEYGILNANVDEIVSIGTNRWDEQWEIGKYNNTTGEKEEYATVIRCKNFIEVNPRTEYTMSIKGRIYYYDKNKTFISTTSSTVIPYKFTTPSTCQYITFSTGSDYGLTYKNDITIMSGEYKEYTPYVKQEMSIEEVVKNLPDYGCSVGDIANELDLENGVYYHRVGSVKMSSLTWSYNGGYIQFRATINRAKPQSGNTPANILCGRYTTSDWASVIGRTTAKTIALSSSGDGTITIYDGSTTDLNTFTANLGNDMIVYELASEEIIPLTNFISPIKSEPNGTITFVNEHNLDVPTKIIYKKEV